MFSNYKGVVGGRERRGRERRERERKERESLACTGGKLGAPFSGLTDMLI